MRDNKYVICDADLSIWDDDDVDGEYPYDTCPLATAKGIDEAFGLAMTRCSQITPTLDVFRKDGDRLVPVGFVQWDAYTQKPATYIK